MPMPWSTASTKTWMRPALKLPLTDTCQMPCRCLNTPSTGRACGPRVCVKLILNTTKLQVSGQEKLTKMPKRFPPFVSTLYSNTYKFMVFNLG